MRLITLLILLLLISLYATSALRPTIDAPLADVPFKSCASASADANISSITADVWPPQKGADLDLNVTGTNSKNITSGTYTIEIKVSGIPLPPITGSIADFRPLPWPIGHLAFGFSENIPGAAPSGSYTLKISAVDQDKDEIFCINLAFTLSAEQDKLIGAGLKTKMSAWTADRDATRHIRLNGPSDAEIKQKAKRESERN